MEDVKEINLFPSGIIDMPPSKSAAHRAIICASLADGESVLKNISGSQDMTATLRCMRGLGMRCLPETDMVTIHGGFPKAEETLLDCGESGSTLRFLIPLASVLNGEISFTGQGRLMERPLTPYMDLLREKGVTMSFNEKTLTVKGPLRAGSFSLAGDVSSQFVSGLLFALPLLAEDSRIEMVSPLQSAPYVDLTIDVMKHFGVTVEHDEYRKFFIAGGQCYQPQRFSVESDYSQAAFFLAAGALGCKCECRGLSQTSKQGDKRILDLLRQCGAKITTSAEGGLIVTAEKLSAVTVDVSDIPDLVPPLAVLFTFCEGTSRIVNAGRLRLKESDRLSALTSELNAIGADIFQGEDSLTITGVKSLKGGKVKSWGDHRIAMALAAAAIRSENPVLLEGSDCVSKSYPNFWNDFEKVPFEKMTAGGV